MATKQRREKKALDTTCLLRLLSPILCCDSCCIDAAAVVVVTIVAAVNCSISFFLQRLLISLEALSPTLHFCELIFNYTMRLLLPLLTDSTLSALGILTRSEDCSV